MDQYTLKLFEDKQFVESVLKMEPEDALKAFHDRGSNVTLDELKEFGAEINKAVIAKNELSESDLEAVAGGKLQDAKIYALGIATGIAIVCVISCCW